MRRLRGRSPDDLVVSKERMQIWMQAEELPESQEICRDEYTYACDAPYCRSRAGLRQTEYGIFCDTHFFYAPNCAELGCFAPAVADPKGGGFCRKHYLVYDDAEHDKTRALRYCARYCRLGAG